MACLSRPCHFRFFKGCLPQISVGPFFNILSHMNLKPPREFNTVFGSCVIFLVHGTILQQWASLLKNSASVAVEESHQPLLNNRSSDCWKILPVTVEPFNQNTIKISYSYMRNISSVTASHSKSILRWKAKEYGYNYRNK